MKIPFKPGWTAWWWGEGASSQGGRKKGERREGGCFENWLKLVWAARRRQKWNKDGRLVRGSGRKKTR